MPDDVRELEKCFQDVFTSGVTDINFFVCPNVKLTVEDLRKDIILFQKAINNGDFTDVDSVDGHIDTVEFNSSF